MPAHASAAPTHASDVPVYTTLAEGGGGHSCALTAGGGVRCWGENRYGQLGNNANSPSSAPLAVTGLSSGVLALANGQGFSCALTGAGGVKCWGGNWNYQLGDNTNTNRKTPVDVAGLTGGVKAITAGVYHACALLDSGAVMCWGRNEFGALGDGTTTNRPAPVAVSGLSGGVIAINAGSHHTCAVLDSGALLCWGLNDFGQLGDQAVFERHTPALVNGLGQAIAVSAGEAHTCALHPAGAVSCWGSNFRSQLGNGATVDSAQPVAVSGLAGPAVQLSAAGLHTCARLANGALQCWGYNAYGQLGDNTRTDRAQPAGVAGLSGVVDVAVGEYHSCAVLAAGALKCWGSHNQGQLGTDTLFESSIPLDVQLPGSGLLDLDTGEYHTCAVNAAGQAFCWGLNEDGQLGDGTREDHGWPAPVAGLTEPLQAIAAGEDHTCALTTSGGVQCWGRNDGGALGDGTRTQRTRPAAVSNLPPASAIAAGYFFTCALTTGGAVKCWGDGNSLGNGSNLTSSTPVAVSGLSSGVQAITAGAGQACALTSAGGVVCWGLNYAGSLGDGTTIDRLSPVAVSGLSSGVRAISAGGGYYYGVHTCALLETGSVKCWGGNYYGQLGSGGSTSSTVPVEVVGLGGKAVALSAGGFHTCAVLESGALRCWGRGYGSAPVTVPGLESGAAAVRAGSEHTCALAGAAARVKCWGSDWAGRLGIGGYAYSRLPVDVREHTPRLALGYIASRPGSLLTLTGVGFTPGAALQLALNGQAAGQPLAANAAGEFIVFLDTALAEPGSYQLSVPDGLRLAQQVFFLTEASPLYALEGGGLWFSLPGGLGLPVFSLYLPAALR